MPITDPRLLDLTVEEMLTDVWAHRFANNPKLLEEIEDDDFDVDQVLADMEQRQQDPGDWETVT